MDSFLQIISHGTNAGILRVVSPMTAFLQFVLHLCHGGSKMPQSQTKGGWIPILTMVVLPQARALFSVVRGPRWFKL